MEQETNKPDECHKPCGANYCEEYGCVDRKRCKTEPIPPDESKNSPTAGNEPLEIEVKYVDENGDEVVKDLNYFIREVALIKGIPLNEDTSIDYHTWASSNGTVEILELQIEAQKRWYKHQLEEQKNTYLKAARFACETLQHTIENQRKEIESLKSDLQIHQKNSEYRNRELSKLTQENEALRSKCKNYYPDHMSTGMNCINCGKTKLEH